MLQKSERWTLEYMNNARKQLGWFSRKYFSVFKNDFEVSKLFRVIDCSYVKWYIQTIKRTEKEQDFDEKRFVCFCLSCHKTLVRIDLIWDFTIPFVPAVHWPKTLCVTFFAKYSHSNKDHTFRKKFISFEIFKKIFLRLDCFAEIEETRRSF